MRTGSFRPGRVRWKVAAAWRCPSRRGRTGSGSVGGPGLVGSLWRYRLVVVVVAAFAAVAEYAVSLVVPARYKAQASLYLRDPGSAAVLTLGGSAQSSQSGDHAVFMATQEGLAGSDVVFERALQLLGRRRTASVLRGSVVVVGPSADLASLTNRATSGDPAEAANLANAVGTAYELVAGQRSAARSEGGDHRVAAGVSQRGAEFDALRAQLAQASGPVRPSWSARRCLSRAQVSVARRGAAAGDRGIARRRPSPGRWAQPDERGGGLRTDGTDHRSAGQGRGSGRRGRRTL